MASKRSNGEGSVTKRKKTRADGTTYHRFIAVVTLGFDANGKQRRIEGPSRKTHAEANRDRLALVKQLVSTDPTAYSTTVEQYMTYWLRHHRQDISERSIYEYEKDIRLHIAPHLGKLKLSDLVPTSLQQWQTRLFEQSPYVARSARACLHAALEQAVMWQILPHNPLRAVKAVKLPKPKHAIWEPSEIKNFKQKANAHPLYPFYYSLLSLGLRRGEARGLKWSDFTNGQVHIQRSLSNDRNLSNPAFGPTKNKSSNRFLMVPNDLKALLEAHHERQLLELPVSPYDLVFCTSVGTPITGSDLNTPFKELCAEHGLKKIRLHDLRHTYASLMIRKGEDVATVSKLLGHSSPNTTLQIYIHEFKTRLSKASYTLDDLIED